MSCLESIGLYVILVMKKTKNKKLKRIKNKKNNNNTMDDKEYKLYMVKYYVVEKIVEMMRDDKYKEHKEELIKISKEIWGFDNVK